MNPGLVKRGLEKAPGLAVSPAVALLVGVSIFRHVSF